MKPWLDFLCLTLSRRGIFGSFFFIDMLKKYLCISAHDSLKEKSRNGEKSEVGFTEIGLVPATKHCGFHV